MSSSEDQEKLLTLPLRILYYKWYLHTYTQDFSPYIITNTYSILSMIFSFIYRTKKLELIVKVLTKLYIKPFKEIIQVLSLHAINK